MLHAVWSNARYGVGICSLCIQYEMFFDINNFCTYQDIRRLYVSMDNCWCVCMQEVDSLCELYGDMMSFFPCDSLKIMEV